MVYLACPYSHPDPEVRESRFEIACKIAAAFIEQGYNVYSPISHSHHIEKYLRKQRDWSIWGRVDREALSFCSLVFVIAIPGWKESKGIMDELFWAKELDIPVLVLTEPKLKSLLGDMP